MFGVNFNANPTEGALNQRHPHYEKTSAEASHLGWRTSVASQTPMTGRDLEEITDHAIEACGWPLRSVEPITEGLATGNPPAKDMVGAFVALLGVQTTCGHIRAPPELEGKLALSCTAPAIYTEHSLVIPNPDEGDAVERGVGLPAGRAGCRCRHRPEPANPVGMSGKNMTSDSGMRQYPNYTRVDRSCLDAHRMLYSHSWGRKTLQFLSEPQE